MTKAIIKKLNEAGAKYEGETDEKGTRHGMGKITFIDGTYYEGFWNHGKREGYGEARYSDGSIYKGEWRGDQRDGQGQLFYANGNFVTSLFKADQRHGNGQLVEKSGVKSECIYFHDLEVKIS